MKRGLLSLKRVNLGDYSAFRTQHPQLHSLISPLECRNRHDTQPQAPTFLNSIYPGSFNYHHMKGFSVAPQSSGPAENFSVPYAASGFDEWAEFANASSYMSPLVVSKWNAENTTLPPGTSISTYGGFPVFPTSDILDINSSYPHGGASIRINGYADPLTAAQERDRALSQEQMRAGPPATSVPPIYPPIIQALLVTTTKRSGVVEWLKVLH